MFVTTGSGSRAWHEYSAPATAPATACVGPQVGRYIADFDGALRAGGFAGSLLLMGSHGGVISAERGCREPITLVESGPVGGCIGAASFGSALGIDNLVAFDMGGTTAKCAMIERGRYAVESIYYIGGPDAGFPIRGNVIDILEVGVGAAHRLARRSSASMSAPSAGSMPGPACYDAAGTVTGAPRSASSSRHFSGGEMNLAPASAAALGPSSPRRSATRQEAVTRAAKAC